MSVDKALALMRAMQESGVSVLEFEHEGFSLKLRSRDRPDAAEQRSTTARQATAEQSGQISAPMTGIVHLSAEPDGPPLCKVGDVLGKGSLLCLLEAMKVLTRVEAPDDLRILSICVTNGAEVSQGDALFRVEPVRGT